MTFRPDRAKATLLRVETLILANPIRRALSRMDGAQKAIWSRYQRDLTEWHTRHGQGAYEATLANPACVPALPRVLHGAFDINGKNPITACMTCDEASHIYRQFSKGI